MAHLSEVLIPSRAVRARFGGIASMTLRRWVERGILPAPTTIAGRNYWREQDVAALQAQSSDPGKGTGQ